MGYVVAAGAGSLFQGDKSLKALKDGLFRGLSSAVKPMDQAGRQMHKMFGHLIQAAKAKDPRRR